MSSYPLSLSNPSDAHGKQRKPVSIVVMYSLRKRRGDRYRAGKGLGDMMGIANSTIVLRDECESRVNDAAVPSTPLKAIATKSIRAIVFSGFYPFVNQEGGALA